MNGGLTVHVRSASIIPSVQPELMEMWSQECWVLCIITGCGAAAVLCATEFGKNSVGLSVASSGFLQRILCHCTSWAGPSRNTFGLSPHPNSRHNNALPSEGALKGK